jgi:DNA-binding GntR family transcriptional regulator
VDDEHQRIYDAISARDAAVAQAELANHLATVQSQVLASARIMAATVEVPEF